MTASVIIATRNRAASVARTLAQLRADIQALGGRIVVVDNGSTDETPQVLQRLSSSLPLTVLCEPRPGKNRALNRALDAAQADLLLFTDDDVDFAPNWIGQFQQAADRWPDHAMFAGPILPNLPCELPPHLQAHSFLKIAYAQFAVAGGERPIAGVSPHGPNFALRRGAIGRDRFDERIGPAPGDTRSVPLGDETEFLRRIRARGGDLVYVPAAWVRHHVEPHQLADRWLFDRSFRAGRGSVLLDPDRSSTRLGAVPRYLWRMLVEAQASYWRESFQGRRSGQFEAGLRLHYLRGQIYQYRRGGLGEARG